MSRFERVYTREQCEAMAEAFEDRRVRPARLVADLAAAGKLTLRGEPVPAFKANEATIRHEARKLRLRRGGQQTSELGKQPHRDAIETLRIRLVNMADGELAALEKQKDGDRDPELIRQVARAVREIAALPGPTEPRPPAPGAKQQGKRTGAETRGGLGGAILADHRADTRASAAPAHEAQPAPPPPAQADDDRDSTRLSPSATLTTNDDGDQQHAAPGALVRKLADAQGVELAGAP